MIVKSVALYQDTGLAAVGFGSESLVISTSGGLNIGTIPFESKEYRTRQHQRRVHPCKYTFSTTSMSRLSLLLSRPIPLLPEKQPPERFALLSLRAATPAISAIIAHK